VYDLLHCNDGDEISLVVLDDKIPTCTEIHLDIISKRDLQNHTVAHAISKRIDDFQEYFEGLILRAGQRFEVSDLRISFVVRSLSPTSPLINASRISWKNLLKIHLETLEFKPSNLCIIAEVAAATQIADVQTNADSENVLYISRHKAILQILSSIEKNFSVFGSDAQFIGLVFSDEVLPFITFDSQTGDETETTSLHSSSLIGAFRKWIDSTVDEFSNRPSNPGAALKYGLEKAQSMNERNNLPTTIVFFSSGIYSTGKNPVKVTRTNLGNTSVRVLSISVGEDSAKDIMEAIAKEGNGISIHMNNESMIDSILDAITDMMTIAR